MKTSLNKGAPIPGRQYRLTGASGIPAISNGNSWAESIIPTPKMLQTEFIMGSPVSAEHYEEMLGAVPPVRMLSNGFLVGEAYDHVRKTNGGHYVPRYQMFVERDGIYFDCGLATTEEFDLWTIPANKREV